MKRWLSLAAVVVLCLALVIGAACKGGEEKEVKQLKLGIGIPLSGLLGAVIGIPAKGAFELANKKIGDFTVAGQKYRWKLIFEDNLMTAAGGVATTTKFVFEHKVDFMHQAGGGAGMASIPICEDKGIILDMAGGDPSVFTDHRCAFQVAATWALNIPPLFDWLAKEHPEVKRVAVEVPDNETGVAVADACAAAAYYYGLQIVASELVPIETTELYPVATKLMAKNPDLVLGPPTLLMPMWDMGYDGLAANYYWLESYAEDAGWDRCKGYLALMPNPIGDVWPEAMTFREEYEDRYHAELTPAAFWAGNVMYVLTSALEQAGTVDDNEKIMETLETGTFDTMVGPLKYGGKALNGVGHMLVWPSPILEVVGEQEYHVVAMYTPEETEAIAAEVYK
jgi:ABC-type branched-subunit amino acid transport system substrate-binding protein